MATDSILARILAVKKEEVAALRLERRADLRAEALDQPPARDFRAALTIEDRVAIIAEIKKASPSAGRFAGPEMDVTARAQAYQEGGAAAMSVLTDGPFFQGCLEDLVQARAAVTLPVLRKDFLIDPLQIYQARVAGADAILLIVAALEATMLEDLYHLAIEVGLTPLVELHDADDLARVLPLQPGLLGINNRNLATMKVDIETSRRLRPLIPSAVTVVAESGISTPEDVRTLRAAGIDAFLIGTTLMRSPNPRAELAGLTLAGDRP